MSSATRSYEKNLCLLFEVVLSIVMMTLTEIAIDVDWPLNWACVLSSL